jgi:hypothetical protein
MKKVTLIFTLLAFYGCFEVERDCNAFKTGRFEFKYVLDGVEKTGIFVRTDSLNIDFFEDTADTSSVRWINDCEFILTKLNPQSNSEKDAIHMKILSTTDNSYTFEYKLAVKKPNRPLRVEKGVATKID